MLTKVFPTGEGHGYGPVEYLCAGNPFGGGEREKAPQVISGNPALIKRQIDAVPFKHKYTSGVYSFAPEDRQTDEQIMEIIAATEELVFAGLPLSSRSILWVQHEHARRTELHFLIPRQEVNSGKSFNAFPPGWQQKYDPLQDKFNYKYGWARPDDPERARHWQPGIKAKILADAKRKEKPNPKAEVFSLTDDLANMAMQGNLSNRGEIISELRKRGYRINRQDKDYLTIIDKDGKKTRLKGTLFEENFNGSDWIKAEIKKIDKPDSEKNLIDQKLAEEADARLQEAIRKTALYNSNRYSIKEIENEQSTGRETTFKSKMDTGNMGSGNERHTGKPASFQKPTDSERNESHAFYSKPGLGESATDRATCATIRGNAGHFLHESSFPDASSSSMGRTVGKGPEMATSHRTATERVHERSDTNSSDSFRAGSGNNRGQSEKPGRNDGADHGHIERVARQGFESGEFLQDFRSLKKSAEKLEDCLARINQADKKLPDIDLGLCPALENMEQIATQTISGLRQAHETRLLQDILIQSVNIAPIATGNLLISGDEAVKSLQALYEQKLFQKLVNAESHLLLPDLDWMSSQINIALQNLVYAHETKILSSISHEPPILRIPDLVIFGHEANILIHSLQQINEFHISKNLSRSPIAIQLPPMASLESICVRAGILLRNVNEARLTQKLGRQETQLCLPELTSLVKAALLLNRRIRSAQEAKIIAAVGKQEQKREKIIRECFLHAELARTDLSKWGRLFAQYKKYPKRLKILTGLIEDAHSRFLEIMAETSKVDGIQGRCRDNPFLMRELGELQEKIDQYNARQNQLEKLKDSGKNEDMSSMPEVEASKPLATGISLKM